MKNVLAALFMFSMFLNSFAQGEAQKVFDTEKEFEKAIAVKGINAGFIEFMAPDGILFSPDPVNGRDLWKKRQPSPASLTWNPVWIEVSSNGALAFSVGNGIYRPEGMDGKDLFYTHYLSIWSRQPNGEYRAVLDAGIGHERPATMPTEWKSPTVSGNTKLQNSAGDHATNFYSMVESSGPAKAYRSFLSDDGFVMREGSVPFVGKSAIAYLEKLKSTMKFSKRKTFIEAGDLAWVSAGYSMFDKNGSQSEKGNFVQVWKLRNGKWMIGADILIPMPNANK